MRLRVYVEDLEDADRNALVAYVSDGEGRPQVDAAVQAQGDAAELAAAAAVAAGARFAELVGEEAVEAKLAAFAGEAPQEAA